MENILNFIEILLLCYLVYFLKFQPSSGLKIPSQQNLTDPAGNPTGDDEFWTVFDAASGKFLFNRCEFHPDMDELHASDKFKVEKTCRQ